MKEEFRKAKTNHIDGNYEFIIDCGDLYFRENVSFEDDLEYCKSIIELYNPIKIKSIKAPPIQINNKSFWLTAKMSPNNNPITSNLIEDKNPITTSPTAKDEWANKPNKASPGNFVVFCNFSNIIAINEEIINTDKAILTLKKTAMVTPSNAECDKVSPKKDSLLQIIKQPIGPVTKAIPVPANNALIKKSSNIF